MVCLAAGVGSQLEFHWARHLDVLFEMIHQSACSRAQESGRVEVGLAASVNGKAPVDLNFVPVGLTLMVRPQMGTIFGGLARAIPNVIPNVKMLVLQPVLLDLTSVTTASVGESVNAEGG
jgi:hypothetical protein